MRGTDAWEENGHILGKKPHKAGKIASIRGKKPRVYRVIILKQMADHIKPLFFSGFFFPIA